MVYPYNHLLSIHLLQLMHHGTFINHMLRIAEMGFNHTENQVIEASYDAWRALIDNFALNLGGFSETRHIVCSVNCVTKINVRLHYMYLITSLRTRFHPRLIYTHCLVALRPSDNVQDHTVYVSF